jgi:hypothetical protein
VPDEERLSLISEGFASIPLWIQSLRCFSIALPLLITAVLMITDILLELRDDRVAVDPQPSAIVRLSGCWPAAHRGWNGFENPRRQGK